MLWEILILDLLLVVELGLLGKAICILMLLPRSVFHIEIVLIQSLDSSSRHPLAILYLLSQEKALLSVRSVNFASVRYGRYYSTKYIAASRPWQQRISFQYR